MSLTREEWIKKCAERLQQRGGMDEAQSIDVAEAQLENLDDDLTEDTVEAADEEMSCWTDDGGLK